MKTLFRNVLCTVLTGAAVTFMPLCAAAFTEGSWQGVFERFVMEQEYYGLYESGLYEDQEIVFRFGLYDLTGDDIPELIVYNGSPSLAGGQNFVIRAAEDDWEDIGFVGFRSCEMYYYKDSAFRGLFCTDGNMGCFRTVYYTADETGITEEEVLVTDYNQPTQVSDFTITQNTSNDALFDLAVSGESYILPMFTYEEVCGIGWDEFVCIFEDPYLEGDETQEETAYDSQKQPDAQDNMEASQPSGSSALSGSDGAFYGVWCGASTDAGEAQQIAARIRSVGFPAEVFLTTDWSNLNQEPWYVITAGTYASQSEADAALPGVQSYVPDAYVAYSGSYIGY